MTGNEEQIFGPVLALDVGGKRIGAAVSDPTLVAIERLAPLRRTNWKRLLEEVSQLIRGFDAQALVIGLPLCLDGSEGSAAQETQNIALKFALSLDRPVFLQDERLTSVEAKEKLREQGYGSEEIAERIDSEAAAIILRDFLYGGQQRRRVSRPLDQNQGIR